MAELTKEWLKQTIAEYEANRDELPFGLDTNSAIGLQAFKLALASLEAEPVAWKVTFTQIDREYNTFTGMYSDKAEVERWVRLHKACNFRADITPLYTAKPVPVTPDGWISCSERMPDKLIPVMVMYEDGEMWSAMWNGNRWDDGTEYPDPHSVTHWREMPAAPKQEVNRG
ncbi:TPA: DUF551 domain-containing protein [Escherichia coli]|uniref:DUF551 domain-containing protein n=1 Tax=Escherichia coli TaxID=562 RepID=UPI001473CC63|nr:DUF551 domain-containing protein [Escherichia coli]MED0341401.1 DUF551 domain-containing protein [Escherichia marmotae]HBN2920520.1 DUF551 domain-containing protein [Escherichia coli O25b:H4-ST131]EFS2085171.1 DUF551 domain-containing protein [Escherichia coli]EHY7631697.1 DUF551 domain-containing protein [Escherichia coli]MCN3469959.1 DUF551 domain-containing protein [Escherichia coli]